MPDMSTKVPGVGAKAVSVVLTVCLICNNPPAPAALINPDERP